MHRRIFAASVLAAFLASPGVVAAEEPLKGIEVADMDRNVEACTDFFEFANGAWRAANPIPPSMSRWSRRWKAGEDAKEQLEGDPRGDRGDQGCPARGASSSSIGDFYGACMNQSERNRLGVKPLGPLLAEIDAMKSAGGTSQRMITRFHALGIPVPFGRHVRLRQPQPQRRHRAASMPSGLGLPDRDYYLKTETRFVEAREKYRRARREDASSSPAGRRARAKAAAATVLRDGEAARRGLARQRRPARPQGDRPQDDLAELSEDDAALRLDGATSKASGFRRATSTSPSRSSSRRSTASSADGASRTGRPT